MIRGTTPTLTFTVRPRQPTDEIDLTEARNIYVTLQRGTTVIEKTGDDLEVTERTVVVYLTQEESLKLPEGADAEVQLNWTYLDANDIVRRAATKVKAFPVTKQLMKRVIE
jgi:hypothetical protein